MIIDGKATAQKIKSAISAEIKKHGYTPRLDVILVGKNEASQIYVRNKAKECEAVGIKSAVHNLPENTTEKELLALIGRLNDDPEVNGFFTQLPLPRHISEKAVIESTNPLKDVDGFHPFNVGRLSIGNPVFAPSTPSGILALLKEYKIKIAGKKAVVVGRSNIVGKPIASMLLKEDATVTICHSKTEDIGKITKAADIIVVAVGKAKFIKATMIKKGCAIIDVGINRAGGKIVGDVDFDKCKSKAAFITPVPGGVGPMTIAMLLSNALKAYKMQKGLM